MHSFIDSQSKVQIVCPANQLRPSLHKHKLPTKTISHQFAFHLVKLRFHFTIIVTVMLN